MGINEEKDLFEKMKKLAQQVSELTGRVTGLEAEVIALRAKNEQLQQNTKQDTNQLSSADLALITSLVGIEHETLRNYLGNEKAQKVQYYAKVALARASRNVDTEKNAYSEAKAWANYHDYYNGGYEWVDKWHKEIENKSIFEIVQIINQMMNGATIQSENQGPQR